MDKGRADNPALEIRKLDRIGMIAIRGDMESAKFQAAMKSIGGAAPGKLEIIGDAEILAAWMAPDEVLVMVSPERVQEATDMLSSALEGEHFLCVDVSDMRTCVQISGRGVRDLLAKGTPADVSPDAFHVGRFRRSLFAQIQAAFWLIDERTVRLLCRRSETDHLLSWLEAMSPSEENPLFFGPK